jgi:HSP20 family molecular chaperone IbpA
MIRQALSDNTLRLGFGEIERQLDRVGRQGGASYPPFNIERTADDGFRIAIAVAGFVPEDLSVELEDRQLTISGRQAEPPPRVYLHRGIAARAFRRRFLLADGLEVAAAALADGILSIDLQQRGAAAAARNIAVKAT